MVYPNNSNIGNLTSPPSEGLGEVLLSSAYFAPIQWYQKLNRYDSCLIEQHDNFVKQWTYLYDFNWEITLKMCELIDIMPCMRRTDAYLKDIPDGIVDFREIIRPKHPGVDSDFISRRYYQVYQQKFGFLPNLSILDLLFNEGNESVLYL